MPPTTAEGVRFCGACGDTAETLDDEGKGPCCHALPNPWHRGSDGLYTAQSATPDFDAEDEEEGEAERPTCGCGSHRWTVTFSGEQTRECEPGDGEIIYYDTENLQANARCAECGDAMPGRYWVEWA